MPRYKKYFKHKFVLNGVELTNVSIGASAIGKFEEPLDEAGLHLPFTTRGYEYPMRGLLQIESEDYAGNKVEATYIILSDEVEEGSKYGEWKHNLRVMEYSGKYDSYLYHTFTYTKPLKNNNPAPFILLSDLNNATSNVGNTFAVYKMVFLEALKVLATYYANENITFPKVAQAVQGTDFISSNQRRFANVNAWVSVDNGVKHTLSSTPYTFQLSSGEHFIDYGFYPIINDVIKTTSPITMYRFYVNAIARSNLSLLDAINIIRDSKPFESKIYHEQTRLFNIDPAIETYLASVEMPQMFLQKATMRQILNTIFSYVNAISRFYYNNEEIDTLSMDEFNKVIGDFSIEDVVAYSSSQEATKLFNQGIVWGERVLPSSFDEETTTTPAENLYKTVRSSQVQITDTNFEIPLEAELYQPIQLLNKVPQFKITAFVTNENVTYNDFILDLTPRLVNREEWLLKNITVDFPSPFIYDAYENNVGLRENRVSNLYWQQGSKSIRLGEVFGELWQTNVIFSTIKEAIHEHITRNDFSPMFYYDENVGSGEWTLITSYEISYTLPSTANFKDLQFQLKYITFESFPFQTHRENITNSLYYSEGRLNQNDKAMNISFASLRAHGDTQRSGVPSIQFQKIYEDYSNLLRWGMKDENDYIIVEEKFEFHNEYVKATYVATKDHNRLSLWTKVDQEYRWQEIPQSNQVFERQEIFNENVVITEPNTTMIEQTTMITSNALNLIFGTLMNEWYHSTTGGKTKVTLSYIRTDGFLEVYPDDYYSRYLILAPVRSFGGKHGFSFVFGFDGNQVAGDAIERKDVSGAETYWNKAIRYTNLNGEFTQMWFAFVTRFLDDIFHDDGFTEQERLQNYPLSRIENQEEFATGNYVTHKSGSMDVTSATHNPLMFGKKDKSQSIKVAIQTSVFPFDYTQYVIGISFFTNNFLVNNPETEFDTVVGTPLYFYPYTNRTVYDKFTTYKIKSGYGTPILLQNGVNVSYSSGQFRFSSPISMTGLTSWAIGDSLGNLYLACNQNYNGFNASRQHFYPNEAVIGGERVAEGDVSFILETSLGINSFVNVNAFEFPSVDLEDNMAMTSGFTITKSTNFVIDVDDLFGISSNFGVLKFEDYVFTLQDDFAMTSGFTVVKSTDYVVTLSDNTPLASEFTERAFVFPRTSISDTLGITSGFTVTKSTNHVVEVTDTFDISSIITIAPALNVGSLSDNIALTSGFTVEKSTDLFVGSIADNLGVSSSLSVTKYEKSYKWVYTGTLGTYDQTVSYNTGTSTCPTTSGTLSWLNTNYPPAGYPTGYDMCVKRLGYGVLCSPLYYYYTIVFS